MIGRVSVLIVLAVLGCVGSWLLGYREGAQTGAYSLLRQMGETHEPNVKPAQDIDHDDIKNVQDIERDEVCNEIRDYKLSIARDLDENTQICGWRDMDSPENSN